jgi:hypothetical protein
VVPLSSRIDHDESDDAGQSGPYIGPNEHPLVRPLGNRDRRCHVGRASQAHETHSGFVAFSPDGPSTTHFMGPPTQP